MAGVIYLDTHVVVWLAVGRADAVPRKVQALLEKRDLLVSPMVLLELQYLYEIGRTTVSGVELMNSLTQSIAINLCDRPFAVVARDALTQTWTRDPFDRIIVAQAGAEMLITKDQNILKHCATAVWD